MNGKLIKKVGFLVLMVLAIFLYRYFRLNEYFSLESLKLHQESLNIYYAEHSLMVLGAFSLLYIVSVAFSFPGASILTLAAGAIFGFKVGTLVVSLSSTVGATLAFLASRYFLKTNLRVLIVVLRRRGFFIYSRCGYFQFFLFFLLTY
jgi:uncharacterized membrane protein YdjX (TVP38/TMEM64 family)